MTVREIPSDLRNKVRAKALSDGMTMTALMIKLMKKYLEGGK
jgi:hypothetical protein